MTSNQQTLDGQHLLYDWRFRFPGDPGACNGWAYNWESAECSTSDPTPRDNWATLFMTTNHTDDPYHDFQEFIRIFNKRRRRSIITELQTTENNNNNHKDDPRQMVVLKENNDVLATGKVFVKSGVEHADPNVGYYAVLLSMTPPGLELLLSFEASANHGYAALFHHSEVDFQVAEDLILRAKTGLGPTNKDNKESQGLLATRFSLEEDGKQIARCHLSYRDGSNDPSVGPTIEMMAVHQGYRGRNLLPLLYHWVKIFVEENWKLECMNTDCPPGHIMLKATQLTNAVVDIRDGQLATDKEFFYHYAGFGVRQQKGAMSFILGAGRPKDEEAVVYLKLLTKADLSERSKPQILPKIDWKADSGPRTCAFCDTLRAKLQRCTRCRQVWYCNVTCQKKDWKRGHKHWCGKTREEVHDKLVELGLRIRQEDGTYVTMAGMPSSLG